MSDQQNNQITKLILPKPTTKTNKHPTEAIQQILASNTQQLK